MKALDRRHKWEHQGIQGGADVHSCRVCGVTQRFERIIPDAFLHDLITNMSQPNLYRTLFR